MRVHLELQTNILECYNILYRPYFDKGGNAQNINFTGEAL